MKTLRLKGLVFSGKAEGTRFIRLPWVKKQIKEKLDFTPYPGTLNVKLTEENHNNRSSLEKADAIAVVPATGFHRGRLFKASLQDYPKCAVVIPQIPNYPRDVIELIAPIKLRDRLKLKDGDPVEVEIPMK